MDYGQPKQSNPINQPDGEFFTTGVGTNQGDLNSFESKDNLDLSSEGAASWGQAPEQDSRKIGSEAIASSLDNPNNGAELQDKEPNQTINPTMPPGYPEITKTSSTPEIDDENLENVIDLSSIKAERNIISPKTLVATEKAVEEFKKGEISPNELANIRWEATKAYLKNSFGRELE